jgi:hypothetical protein
MALKKMPRIRERHKTEGDLKSRKLEVGTRKCLVEIKPFSREIGRTRYYATGLPLCA